MAASFVEQRMTSQQTFTATIPQALETAIKHHQARNFRGAEQIYRQILQIDPQHVDALHLLGMAINQLGQSEAAIAYISEALRLRPEFAEAHNTLGNVFNKLGRNEEAAASYRRALGVKADYAEAHSNLGVALKTLGKTDEAIASYQQAIRLKPDYADAHHNLGVALMHVGRLEEAVVSIQQALRLNPRFVQAHGSLGSAFRKLGRLEEAVASYRQAVRLKSDDSEAHNQLGGTLIECGKLAEALIHIQEALRLKPDSAFALNNLGITLADFGHLEEAVASYREAIRLDPDCFEAHGNLAMALLLMGDFEQGWREYEWRFQNKEYPLPHFPQPIWDGSPLAGRKILLRTEGGLGDTLHFIRYAPLVKELGGTVLVECEKKLIPLLASCPGIDRLVRNSSNPTEQFDLQAPLLSLPRLLGTTQSTVPAKVPYLSADTKLVEKWRQALRFFGGFKIGIAWQGNVKQSRQGYGRRSIPLTQFAVLGLLEGVSVFSLQKGAGSEQLPGVAELFSITDLCSWIDESSGAFMETAAVMKCLDLVITIDTSIAHLAGALGVPVWVALPFAPEWRWLMDREDSVWYPTMRLFRQKEPGNWKRVFERIASEVSKLLPRTTARTPVAVEISPGELIDKITILEIKAERVTNADKLRNVRVELGMLRSVSKQALPASVQLESYTAKLKAVNSALWEIEDGVRSCEAAGEFGPHFIELARSVYHCNDERAALKRAVNELLGSRLIEEKSYIS
jgi:tetratricopeptide (TPR) repeat protein